MKRILFTKKERFLKENEYFLIKILVFRKKEFFSQ